MSEVNWIFANIKSRRIQNAYTKHKTIRMQSAEGNILPAIILAQATEQENSSKISKM